MHRCFGPTHGPLSRPCLTPVDVIGELLKQSGSEKLTIYEVLMRENRTSTEPVQLTLTNYKLPYDEIKADPQKPGQSAVNRPARSVAPTFVIPPASKSKAPMVPELEQVLKAEAEAEAGAAKAAAEESAAVEEVTDAPTGTCIVMPEEPKDTVKGEEVHDEPATDDDTGEAAVEDSTADVLPDDAGDEAVPGEAVDRDSGTGKANQLGEGDGTDADSADEPKVPDEPVIQSGPYAGMTKSQKRAAKAAKQAAANKQ